MIDIYRDQVTPYTTFYDYLRSALFGDRSLDDWSYDELTDLESFIEDTFDGIFYYDDNKLINAVEYYEGEMSLKEMEKTIEKMLRTVFMDEVDEYNHLLYLIIENGCTLEEENGEFYLNDRYGYRVVWCTYCGATFSEYDYADEDWNICIKCGTSGSQRFITYDMEKEILDFLGYSNIQKKKGLLNRKPIKKKPTLNSSKAKCKPKTTAKTSTVRTLNRRASRKGKR